MYATDYTLEVPVVIEGLIVGYSEQDCRIVVDECCDLIKVGFSPWTRRTGRLPVSIWITRDSAGDKSIIFQEAREAVKRCKVEIADLCQIPWPVEAEPDPTDHRTWRSIVDSALTRS